MAAFRGTPDLTSLLLATTLCVACSPAAAIVEPSPTPDQVSAAPASSTPAPRAGVAQGTAPHSPQPLADVVDGGVGPWPPAEPPLPSDGRQLWSAPSAFDHLVLKVGFPPDAQFRNLRYEGHNGLLHRGATSAAEIAGRWQAVARGTRGVFVLRDSLFSQQDYVYGWEAHALMLPPNWVTTAVVETAAKRPLRLPLAPALDDDAAWTAIANAAAMFGSFPPSDGLYTRAVRPLGSDGDRETRATRANVRILARYAATLAEASSKGAAAVAAAGAELIASGDTRYFGAPMRYHRIIPILVENPNRREMLSEGKGLLVDGRSFPDDLVTLTRDAILARRLHDGDIAIERYDLSVPAERKRALDVLRALVPARADAADTTTVWLWVTGKLDASGKKGESAGPYLPRFLEELRGAAIDVGRVQVLSKPAFQLPTTGERSQAFVREARWFRRHQLPLATTLSSTELHDLMLTLH